MFHTSFLILSRLLLLTLKNKNNINCDYYELNELEKKVIEILSKKLDVAEILDLIEILNKNKQNTIDLNLDIFSSIFLFLNNLKKSLKKNE